MPDQYGRVTGQDWLGIAGAISNIDSMRRNREYLGIQKAQEKRAATGFEQSQEDRTTRLKAQQDVANGYIQGGVVDQQGQITDKGYKIFANSQTQDKGMAVKTLEGKGKDAFAYLKASTEFTGNLLSNATNQKNLQMLAFDKANKNYEKIDGLLKAAQVETGRGQSEKAAQYVASAVEDGMMRKHAKAVGDKIEIWEIAGGVRQPSEIMTVQEALTEAQNYTRKNYTLQAATHIVAGYEQNKKPKVFEFRTPEGKKTRAVQIFRSGKVDYIFFNPDGTVLKNAPENIEQAYEKGWDLEGKILEKERAAAKEEREVSKSAADIALTKARTREAGKPKAEKPEKELVALEKSGKRWSEISKPEAMIDVDFDTGEGRVKPHNLSNFNALQKARKLPIMIEQKDKEGHYDYIPDASIYVDRGDKLEKLTEGKGIEYIRSLPTQTQELVIEVLKERQAEKAGKLKEKRKGKQKKANAQREATKARKKAEEAARKRNILYRQAGAASGR